MSTVGVDDSCLVIPVDRRLEHHVQAGGKVDTIADQLRELLLLQLQGLDDVVEESVHVFFSC